MYGPSAPLAAGRHKVEVMLTALTPAKPGSTIAKMDIVVGGDAQVLQTRILTAEDLPVGRPISVAFDIEVGETTFGFQVRTVTTGQCGLCVERRVNLQKVN